MTVAARSVVRNRLVVHIHGYQLTAPERFHRRFARDLATFGTTWSVATETGRPKIGARHASWSAQASGPDWQVQTDYQIVRLDDLIELRHRQPFSRRMAQGIAGLSDFLLDRAIVGYFRYSWRYALFTLAPLVMMLGAVLAGVFTARALAASFGTLPAAIVGSAVFAAAFAFAGRKWYLFTLLEDWAFASILVRRLEPGLDLRLEESRRDLQAAIDRGGYDEILLIGHSLGAALILHLAEKLLLGFPPETQGPALARPRIAILTIGSSVLKIALHSKARNLKRATETVTASPLLSWADYFSRHDLMNFPHADPAASMGVRALYPPVSRKAVFRQMLDPAALKRLRFDPFRTHNQFFHAATRRSLYDYFMFVCGPFSCADLATGKDGAIHWLDRSGAIVSGVPNGAPSVPPAA